MTFLEKLQSRKGGLIRLKTELFWYGGPARGRGWDGNPGRICLLLDAADNAAPVEPFDVADTATTRAGISAGACKAAYLLIDGSHHWVCMVQEDVELI